MGIMYKLMKHKHCLEMDLAKRNERTHKQDKQFTAEYIIELCKFLAEKSQKNKQKQQADYVEYKLKAAFEFDEMDPINDIEMEEVTAAAMPHTNHKRFVDTDTIATIATTATIHTDVKQILTTKQQFNAKTVPTTISTNTLQLQQDNKKDILQKIRNQIFERKRQRQLASMQRIGGVWRPW